MTKFEQDDLVQHIYNKRIYRVVGVDEVANEVKLEEYTHKDIEIHSLHDEIHSLQKLDSALVPPNSVLYHRGLKMYFKLDGMLPKILKAGDKVQLRSVTSATLYELDVEEIFRDFTVKYTMNFIEAIAFLTSNPDVSVTRTSYSAKSKEEVQFYLKTIGEEPVMVTQYRNQSPEVRNIVSDIDKEFEVYTGHYKRYDGAKLKAEFEELEKEVKPLLEKVERYKQLKKILELD